MNKKRLVIFIALVVVILVCTSVFMSIMFGSRGASNVALTKPSMYNDNSAMSSYGFAAPGRSSDLAQEKMMPQDAMIAPRPESAPIVGINPEDRKIVKNGNLSIVVKNVEESAKQITDRAVALGGYASETNFYNSGQNESRVGYIRFRIPVDKVNDFVTSVKQGTVKVQNENINSRDVTSDYIDLQARITNLEASEKQLQELMSRAGAVKDVLEVQRELTNTRTQIEQLKGQLKYLEGSSALSDITVHLALDAGELPIPPEEKWQPGTVFKLALRELITLGRNLSYLVIYLAVFAIIWVPVGFGLKWLYKYLRKKIK